MLKSMKMTEGELLALLDAEHADALAASQSGKLSQEREAAQLYYQGDMSRDMPNMEGRSRAVSSDVSDTVEGLMPILMEIFCGSDDVVKFEPVGPEDVKAAQQETDYVNHVFMQKNPGFMVLYSMIKDALLSKVGIVKIWTEEEEDQPKKTYYDQTPDVLAVVQANPEYEVTEKTEHDGLIDFTVVCKPRSYKCHRVCAVPPEEFGISRSARDIQSAGYLFHTVNRRQADLIDDGYDEDQVEDLPSYHMWQNSEQQARDTVDESMFGMGDEGMNQANRLIAVTEHSVVMNYDGSGPKQWVVVTAGESGSQQILTRDGQLDITEVDRWKFAAITPVPQTHRFFGRSIADMVMDIQQIKTALLRGLLDNAYAAIMPRPIVAESGASDTTLDDLLTFRHGMPIRVKTPDAIMWTQVPFVGGELLPVVQFLDATREWRTGVSRQGQGLDPNALQNQVATIANQMQDAAQQKVKLIARIFAETGIKDLFSLLHAEIREYGDQAQTVRLRNQWVTIDPTQWKQRDDMTINVGLGSGNKGTQLAHFQMIAGAQEKLLAAGMVSKNNLWGSAQELVRLGGRKDAATFFTDPSAPPDPNDPNSQPIPPPADPNQQKMQHEIAAKQAQAQVDQQKAQADVQREAAQAQSEMAIAQRKAQLEEQTLLLKSQLEQDKHERDMQMQMLKQQHDAEKHRMTLEMQANQHMVENARLVQGMEHDKAQHAMKMNTSRIITPGT